MILNYKKIITPILNEYIYIFIPFCLSLLICILLFGIVTLIT